MLMLKREKERKTRLMASFRLQLACSHLKPSYPERSIYRKNISSTNHRQRSILHNKPLLFSCKRPYVKSMDIAAPDTSITKANELLNAYEDEYNGVIIDPQSLPDEASAFASVLQSSLISWKLEGKKGVWLKILEQQAGLVPIALKQGFSYHHAEKGYVMLTYWIPDEPCVLPSTSTHQIGVGAFVMNENQEVLVVKEKKCPLRFSGMWKLPTGFINKSEEIFNGAIREVKEETGIETTFLEVVAFRHAHQVAFDKSDLFFVCMLKPLTLEINIDESEIEEAKWMFLEDFLSLPFHRDDKLLKSITSICISKHQNKYHGFTAQRMMSKFDDRLTYLYHGCCL